jgi:hypothetical protein
MPVSPMPVKLIEPAVGDTYLTRFEQIETPCKVVEIGQSYGRIRILVTPVGGRGSQWVEIRRINGEMGPYQGTGRIKLKPESEAKTSKRSAKKIRPFSGRKGAA